MRRMIQGYTALTQEMARASRPGSLKRNAFTPAVGFVIAGAASLFLWVVLLLVARWIVSAVL